MEEEKVVPESTPEEVSEVSEDVKTPEESPAPEPEEKTVPYERFKAVNSELAKLKKQPPKTVYKTNLDIDDFIQISATLEGLDPKEREYLAREHTLTGKPLQDIKNDENFLLWQSAYRQKVEKESKALKPGNGAMLVDAQSKSFEQKLAELPNNMGSLAEKEKMLTEAGLYKAPRQNPNRTNIGQLR